MKTLLQATYNTVNLSSTICRRLEIFFNACVCLVIEKAELIAYTISPIKLASFFHKINKYSNNCCTNPRGINSRQRRETFCGTDNFYVGIGRILWPAAATKTGVGCWSIWKNRSRPRHRRLSVCLGQ